MSRIPDNRVSVEGLRRRTVPGNPKSLDDNKVSKASAAAKEEVVQEDTMDDIASVELGRKPSMSSNGNANSDLEDHLSDEEPRCDEALLKCEDEIRLDDAQSSSDAPTTNGQDTEHSDGEISQESSPEISEYKDSVDDQEALSDNDEQKEQVSEGTGESEEYVSEGNRESGEEEKVEDLEPKEDVQNGNDEDEEELSDEEAETRLPLQVKVITTRSSTGSGRTSPVDSDCEVECAYIPTRVVVAAENLRETAGHLREQAGHFREHIGEQAGHLREQIGEQAGHIKEQIDAGAGQIVQFGGQIREQVGEQAQKVVHKAKDIAWQVQHHNLLPHWLKDNDFLHNHHRPQLQSFKSCFRSIFRIHTETGNIWTHMIGCLTFLIMMIYFLVTSILSKESWEVIVVYMAFFIGAFTCLGFSTLFHTCSCHSDKVSKIFSKLDYSGISLLIVGSFIPWLYFGFYCQNISRWFYISLIIVLGGICLMVALKDKFAEPGYRTIRAALFISLGLSAVIPAMHFLILQGVVEAFTKGSFGWMLFMGALYIGGALLYAMRIPERFFPGKCDLMLQSHQIFHVMVVAAAFVHYHGLNLMAGYREEIGECIIELEEEVLPYTPVA